MRFFGKKDNDENRLSSGYAYFAKYDYENAITEFQKDVNQNPHNFEYHKGLGLCYLKILELQNSYLIFKDKSLENIPEPWNAKFNLTVDGLVHRKLSTNDNFKKYIKYFEESDFLSNAANFEFNEALRLQPDNFDLHYLISLVYLEIGDLNSALYEIKKSLQINPTFFEGFFLAADILSCSEEFDSSLEYYDKAFKIDSNNFELWRHYALTLEDAERFEETLKAYDKARDIYQYHNTELLFRSSQVLSRLGAHEGAIKFLDKILKVEIDNAYFLFHKAIELQFILNYKEALKIIDKILKIDKNPKNEINYLLKKAELLGQLGKDDEALKYYDKANSLKSDN